MLKRLSYFAVCISLLSASFASVSAQWVQISFPADGRITILTTVGKNIFAGTDKGLFRSTNSGSSWSACSTGIQGRQILALIENNGKFFASVGNIVNASVFMSADSGMSWSLANSGLTGIAVLSFAAKGANLFAGADSGAGVFVSTNNSGNWTAASKGLVASVRSLMVSGPNLVAGAYEGLFLSSDNGLNWSAVHSGLPASLPGFYCFSLSGNYLYTGTSPNGVFRSEDNGASWTAASSGLADTTIHSIAASGSAIFAGTDKGIFVSTTRGSGWSSANTGMPSNAIVWSLAVTDSFIFTGIDHFDGSYHREIWRRPLSEFSTTGNCRRAHEITYPINFDLFFSNKSNSQVSFYLPDAGFVSLTVYDISGRITASLTDGFLESGFHCFQWDTRAIAAGCYTIRMKDGLHGRAKSILISR